MTFSAIMENHRMTMADEKHSCEVAELQKSHDHLFNLAASRLQTIEELYRRLETAEKERDELRTGQKEWIDENQRVRDLLANMRDQLAQRRDMTLTAKPASGGRWYVTNGELIFNCRTEYDARKLERWSREGVEEPQTVRFIHRPAPVQASPTPSTSTPSSNFDVADAEKWREAVRRGASLQEEARIALASNREGKSPRLMRNLRPSSKGERLADHSEDSNCATLGCFPIERDREGKVEPERCEVCMVPEGTEHDEDCRCRTQLHPRERWSRERTTGESSVSRCAYCRSLFGTHFVGCAIEAKPSAPDLAALKETAEESLVSFVHGVIAWRAKEQTADDTVSETFDAVRALWLADIDAKLKEMKR